MRYADGTSETILWRLGQNVFSIDDPRVTASSPIVFGDRPKGAMPRLVHAFHGSTPAPAKEIREIAFESTDAGSALILFGMGGVQR